LLSGRSPPKRPQTSRRRSSSPTWRRNLRCINALAPAALLSLPASRPLAPRRLPPIPCMLQGRGDSVGLVVGRLVPATLPHGPCRPRAPEGVSHPIPLRATRADGKLLTVPEDATPILPRCPHRTPATQLVVLGALPLRRPLLLCAPPAWRQLTPVYVRLSLSSRPVRSS
jgi:hypothetical protein